MTEWSRRAMLTAGTAVGAVGISGFVSGASAEAGTPRTLLLHAFNMQLLGKPERPSVGEILTVHGMLKQPAGRTAVGEVFITGALMAGADQDTTLVSSFEHHLFRIGDDTITGSGVVHQDGAGTFTVTGGSGRYAGVRGTYASRQSADHAGEGTAQFSFLFHR